MPLIVDLGERRAARLAELKARSFAPRDLLDARHEILARIDDRIMAALRLCDVHLLFASERPDDGATQRLRPLAGNQPDPARRGVEGDSVALGDVVDLANEILHGQALEHYRRGHLAENGVLWR